MRGKGCISSSRPLGLFDAETCKRNGPLPPGLSLRFLSFPFQRRMEFGEVARWLPPYPYVFEKAIPPPCFKNESSRWRPLRHILPPPPPFPLASIMRRLTWDFKPLPSAGLAHFFPRERQPDTPPIYTSLLWKICFSGGN